MSENKLNETPVAPTSQELGGLPDYSFEWLNNEHALREEGAYYGLVEGDTKEKENSIREYFQIFIQSLKKGIEIDETTLSSLTADSAKIEEKRLQLIAEREQWFTFSDHQQHSFYRYLAGILAYSFMLIFNFGLIFDTLSTSTNNPLWLALGLYLFAMLSQIRRVSNIYSADQQVVPELLRPEERWKIYAEEYGIPIVGALFVVLFGEPGTTVQAVMIFILVLTLFIFAGKGFWQSWFQLQEEYKILRSNRLANKNRKQKLKQVEADLILINSEAEKNSEERQSIKAKIRDLYLQLARAEAHMVATISYFKSEFDLARSSKRLGIFG